MGKFQKPSSKRLDLYLIMGFFKIKELFPGSKNFTGANLQIPQISKHF